MYKYPDLRFYLSVPAVVNDYDEMSKRAKELSSFAAFDNFFMQAPTVSSVLYYRDELGLPCIGTSTYVNSYPQLRDYVDAYKMREIIITEPLNFNVPRLRTLTTTYNKIVMKPFCGVDKISYDKITDPQRMHHWFLRPEATKIKDFNRGITLDFSDETNYIRVNKLLDVYDEHLWEGTLNFLHPALPEIDNRFITTEFDLFRLQCDQKCMSKKSCYYCSLVYENFKKFEALQRAGKQDSDEKSS